MESTSVLKKSGKKTKKPNTFMKNLYRDRYLYMMLIPILVYYIIFKYAPMYGVSIAFKDFRFVDGIAGSDWVGLKHFIRLFSTRNFYDILKNTLWLNFCSILFVFPMPIILAIMINDVMSRRYKKLVQSFLYIPHFISWIVLGKMFIAMLSPSTGVVNIILNKVFGIEPIFFMGNNFWWQVSFIVSSIWQSAGWGTIIYLAAITAIDNDLYEAAEIDGAGKFRQIWHVTLPGIRSTIAIMLILRVGTVMDVGFEQIYALQNPTTRSVSEVISTYVYRIGIEGAQYSYTTAIGLFQSVVGFLLVVGTNKLIKSMGENGLW